MIYEPSRVSTHYCIYDKQFAAWNRVRGIRCKISIVRGTYHFCYFAAIFANYCSSGYVLSGYQAVSNQVTDPDNIDFWEKLIFLGLLKDGTEQRFLRDILKATIFNAIIILEAPVNIWLQPTVSIMDLFDVRNAVTHRQTL